MQGTQRLGTNRVKEKEVNIAKTVKLVVKEVFVYLGGVLFCKNIKYPTLCLIFANVKGKMWNLLLKYIHERIIIVFLA